MQAEKAFVAYLKLDDPEIINRAGFCKFELLKDNYDPAAPAEIL
jgi:hypothetical protein